MNSPDLLMASPSEEIKEVYKDFDYNQEIDPTGATDTQWPSFKNVNENDERNDHFIMRDGKQFAGTHLIIDLWGASKLDDLQAMEQAFREAVTECGATLLHIHMHHFTPNGGISGVAVLAESHISVHTWPERDYAAFDVFMCGDAEPHRATEILRKAFLPSEIKVNEILRGEVHN